MSDDLAKLLVSAPSGDGSSMTDNGVGVVRSLDSNGEEYVRVVQILYSGRERRRYEFNPDGTCARMRHFDWNKGKGACAVDAAEGPNVETVSSILQSHGYQT